MTWIVCVGIAAACFIMPILYAALVVSSRCSRQEEADEMRRNLEKSAKAEEESAKIEEKH